MISILLIGLYFITFQETCEGAPGLKMIKKDLKKRAVCTESQMDKRRGCPTWKKRGFCAHSSVYHKFMMENCYASCGLCQLLPAEAPKACTANEMDKKGSFCTTWKERIGCSGGYEQFMKENCYATCGYCIMAPTPIPHVDPDACLQAHNAKRALHGAPALMWDDKLAQDAKNWADHLASIGYPVHAQNIDEGENLFSSSSGFVSSCSDAVESWYSEIEFYNFQHPGFSKATGHFTAVVWKSTTKMGAALTKIVSDNGMTRTFVVARYSPAGNVRGQFAANVKPKSS